MCLARFDFPGKSLLIAIATVPFVLPTIVVAAAFTALLGPNGTHQRGILERIFGLDEPPVQLLNTLWIVLIAHVFYNFALATRVIASYWSNLDNRYGDAAATLGARPSRDLPDGDPPAVAVADSGRRASIVFLFSFTSFGVVLVLGGPAYDTLEVVIYRETAFLFNLPVAAALAVVQVLFTFIVTTSYTWAQSQSRRPAVSRNRPARRPQRPLMASGGRRYVVHAWRNVTPDGGPGRALHPQRRWIHA